MTKYVDRWPRSIRIEGGFVANPSPEQCRAAGYELRTDEMREAERLAAEDAARAAPYEISKLRLLKAFDSMGLLDTIVGFINMDPKRKLYWDAAVTLDSDDPMIVDAKAAIMQLIPTLDAESVDTLMRGARVGGAA